MIIIYCIVLDIILILSGGVATIFDRVILLDAFWGLQNESLKPSRHIRLASAHVFFSTARGAFTGGCASLEAMQLEISMAEEMMR